MIKEDVLRCFVGRNVLVTGGTGLIGRQVVAILYDAGAHVRIVSLDKINVNDKAEHVYGDLTSFEFCKDITKGVVFVFHVAGIKGSVMVTQHNTGLPRQALLTISVQSEGAPKIQRNDRSAASTGTFRYSRGGEEGCRLCLFCGSEFG